jgi:hypothetical protein
MTEQGRTTKLVRIPKELTDRAASIAALSEEMTGVPAEPGAVMRTALRAGLEALERAIEPAKKLGVFPVKPKGMGE